MTPALAEKESQALTRSETPEELPELPKELGVLLVVAGVIGVILPGPIGTPVLIAGGFVLWPGASGRASAWLQRRHPRLYVRSVGQIQRFLIDIERRYPSPRKS